ncbi:MAG: replication-associated recombination protein A [Deltaproteobacteria bacterium]|nr:replication-associated recombination protein A [Kofleriaceae bacterium]
MDLFSRNAEARRLNQPLAERMRPQSLAEFIGQEHLLGAGRLLGKLAPGQNLPSLLLWGPPGTGKTTLARLLAEAVRAHFVTLSAVQAGVKEVREAVAEAAQRRDQYGRKTVLFIDEIHRFSRTQQDALLPHVEAGTVTLIGATTENPSFGVVAALLSRARVVRLEALGDDALLQILRRALADKDRGLGALDVRIADEVLHEIAALAGGDGRRALGVLEAAVDLARGDSQTAVVDRPHVIEAAQTRALAYDKAGDEHYAVISAFIKSMRGSDPDAAAYWLARMLEAGEDPRFLLRRLVIFASEDVGNADPQALVVATAALHAFELVGLPEGALVLTQATVYLACAPKSNTALTTYAAARKLVRERGALPVPPELRNAATALAKTMGHGQGYRYPHDFEGAYVPADYLPAELVGATIYQPTESGYEAELKARLQALAARRKP